MNTTTYTKTMTNPSTDLYIPVLNKTISQTITESYKATPKEIELAKLLKTAIDSLNEVGCERVADNTEKKLYDVIEMPALFIDFESYIEVLESQTATKSTINF